MCELMLVHEAQAKQISVGKVSQPQDLAKLLQGAFAVSEDIIGITDTFGKFYDLNFAVNNLSTLHSRRFNLVTSKQLPSNAHSFARDTTTHRSSAHNQKDSVKETKCEERQDSWCKGVVCDLNIFSEIMSEYPYAVVCCNSAHVPVPGLFPYFVFRHSENSIRIYYRKTLCAYFTANEWTAAFQDAHSYLKLFHAGLQAGPPSAVRRQPQEEPLSLQVKERIKHLRAIFETFYQEGLVNELECYKFKVKLLENPETHLHKYRDCRTKAELYDRMKRDVIKRREELKRYENIINGSRKVESREGRSGGRREIPIIVRKYDNAIETVTTSYPLSMEQQQAINILMELELKGLASEKQAVCFKKHILQNSHHFLQLFYLYSQGEFDQLEFMHLLNSRAQAIEHPSELNRGHRDSNMGAG